MTTRAWIAVTLALVALAWALGARITGPSDVWDQTQPKTIGYTADMLVNGQWMVPSDRGVQLATKPPLYNWLAAPIVAAVGLESELAHKFPSVLALILTCVVVVIAGRRLGPETGWLAACMLVSNYFMFKLGYLARPDMVLVFCMTVAWLAATRWIGEPERRSWLVLFWVMLGLAGLVKGPVSLLAVVYLIVATRVLGGRFRMLASCGWWWGLPLALLPFVAWIVAVWRVDPAFVTDHLWANEVWGRVVGEGTESEAASGWLESLPHMPWYVMSRFAPWSFILMMVVGETIIHRVRGRARLRPDPMISGGLLYLIIFVIVFSLSVGKRADYLAPAIPAVAIAVAWWLQQITARWTLAIVAVGAAASMTALTITNQRQDLAPTPDYGEVIREFTGDLADIVASIDRETEPLIACWCGTGPVPPMVGVTREADSARVLEMIEAGEPFWILAGLKTREPRSIHAWLAKRRPSVSVEIVLESPERPRSGGWLEQMRLYRITP